jgi:ubiquinone/menaquinone biosynthesis C-methylase UbiE
LNRRDRATLEFVEGVRSFAVAKMYPPIKHLWDERLVAQGRAPARAAEAAELMDELPTVRFRDFLKRQAQERMWDSIHRALKPAEADLVGRLDEFAQRSEFGRLELDPDLEFPDWFEKANFHLQPGAYWGDDMTSYVYDLAARIYHLGTGQERRVTYMVAGALPRSDYQRVLDLGSGPAKSTLPFKKTFPDAEVFGVDMSAAMVKYGHMLAEEEGMAITFSQQNAEHLKYPDGYFDLVHAMILFHELPPDVLPRVTAEALRVLRPGGHFVVADLPPYRETDVFDQWISAWEVRHNNEPYWISTLTADLPAMMRDAGFARVSESCPNPDAGRGFPANLKFPWMTVGEKA